MPSLEQLHPWVSSPVICSGPMALAADHELAVAVTLAGGIGFIGAGYAIPRLPAMLSAARAQLSDRAGPLPIGVGFLCFTDDLDACAAALITEPVAAVWLFAARTAADYGPWAARLRADARAAGRPAPAIWVQAGSVAEAVGAARACAPDVLVVQGTDGGGHGLEQGAGVVALVPEVADALAAAGCADVALVAAGGIAEGRGAAAALALGADGVVMGTRFLAAREVRLPAPGLQRAIVAAADGGQRTVRAKVFDELKGPNAWPATYNGRGIRNASYADSVAGTGIERVRELYAAAAAGDDRGFVADDAARRVTVWAGTGVGLVRQVMSAADIVKEVREDAKSVLARAAQKHAGSKL